jgi:predicted AlkP superfamily phosphohydrolase/phosphomutase
MRTLVLGFDAFDPSIFERLSGQGKLPNLTRYVEAGGYARFAVVNPPQTEVSWTSIATGLNPGGHGIFDFVHRDPATYTPYVSLLPTKRGPWGTQFVPPFKARTIFEEVTRQGFPATALWWPATFPARPDLPVRTLPGLGTPDIQGRWGIGTLFSAGMEPADEKRKTVVASLERSGKERYDGLLAGPVQSKRGGSQPSMLALHLDLTGDGSARLAYGKHSVELSEGKWSPILEFAFKVGRLFQIPTLARVILVQVHPHVRLYVSPLGLHPLHSPWRYATPPSFVRQVWKACGPFLTLGWPQDTTALEDGCITDGQFLNLCESIFDVRERILMYLLQHSAEGLLASVFDSMDRVQHMFRRDRPDIVDEWYVKLDALVGRVCQRLADLGQGQTRVIVVSDHGFADFTYKVHLNRWLMDRGYLVTKEDGEADSLRGVDWSRSQAYAVGLNSLYLNLAGREGQGTVLPEQVEALVHKLRDELLEWQGPDGHRVVQSAQCQSEAFTGPLAAYGPDIVVGFSPGYRASAETGLGKWGEVSIEPNRDHWGADHCVAAQAVPGVLFCNQGLAGLAHPSYLDFPALAIGVTLESGSAAAPPSYTEEDQEIVEERLRSLGYL